MIKRKDFILGAVAGLAVTAAATAGGVLDWPTAHAETGPVAGVSGRLTPSTGNAPNFAPPQGAPLSFADIFQQVAPAVVQIDVTARIRGDADGMIQIPGTPFRVPLPNGQGGEDAPTTQGAGSGFFISTDGYIVTNNHVVADATEIKVKLADERELTARVVGRDPATDLAVIKVEGTDFPFVTFEETAEPRVGDWVIAVGNPFGLGGTATAGIVSAKGRNQLAADTPYTDYLQIDAAINRGNSGGPTFDIYGRVIGVNSAIYSPTGNSVGIGFAIPASTAKAITDRLMRGETIERGYLGVQITTLSPEQAEANGMPDGAKGALIADVTADGPADRGGLQTNDVVVGVNGTAIDSSTQLTRLVGNVKPGDNLRLDIYRDGRRQTVNVRSGTRPDDIEAAARGESGSAPQRRGGSQAPASAAVEGLTVEPLTTATRERSGVAESVNGVVITDVASGSAAARTNILQPGMVITRAGSRAVSSPADLAAAVADAKRAGRPSILLFLTQAGQRGTVVLRFAAE